jgi:hypothetical protein
VTEENKLGRREFLKLTLASAAAAGLSHFQFLNVAASGGSPLDHCDGIASDVCDPQNNNPDYKCTFGSDECRPDQGDPDLCAPGFGEPDECIEPLGDPDYRCPGPGQDFCEPQAGDPDLCNPPEEPDECEPMGSDPYDECDPYQNDDDMCVNFPADECQSLPEPDYPGPTAVEMAAFNAGWTGQGVLLEWETASEVDSLGFNLYRSRSAASGYARINETLIPCQSPGNPTGASYSYLDLQAPPDTVCFYVIEALDARGNPDRYGPVQANPLRRLLPARRRPSPQRPPGTRR